MKRLSCLAVLFALLLAGCAGNSTPPETPAGPTADELENGFGPVRTVTLGEVDAALVSAGEEVFIMKCSACHKMTERYVGPPLGDVLERRSAAYVMNMMLNPAEMVEKHPEARKMLGQFMTPMPDQHLTQEDARAVLEYLRTQSAH